MTTDSNGLDGVRTVYDRIAGGYDPMMALLIGISVNNATRNAATTPNPPHSRR